MSSILAFIFAKKLEKKVYISFSINCPGGGLRGSYEKNQLTPEGQEQL